MDSQVLINNFSRTRCHTHYKPVIRTEFIMAQRSDFVGPGVQYSTHMGREWKRCLKIKKKKELTSIDR